MAIIYLKKIMKLSFFGAAKEVTGSCSLLETNTSGVLIDCGAFQGGDFVEERNNDPFVFEAEKLSAVIITHAHLDHIGRLPMLIKSNYNGFIYATPPTIELIKIVLEDAHDVMVHNSKKYGSPVLYSLDDVAKVIEQCKSVDYYEEKFISEQKDLSFKFYEAGHIFGSAFVEIKTEGKKIIFSGDFGNINVPILRDSDDLPSDVDVLICESTYGNREHDNRLNRQDAIMDIVKRAMERGGTLMMPAFSVERTQEIMYDLNELIDHRNELPKNIPIFLDSPLAIEATEVFGRHVNYFDKDAKKFIFSGDDLFNFSGLKICYSREESKNINSVKGPKIIIAGAGMMNGGRIQHHALRYLFEPNSTIFFTGFQAFRTLGRKILEGNSPVNILGHSVDVKCHVEYVDVLSAHADKNRLFEWVSNKGNAPKKIFLNHGDIEQIEPFAERIKNELKIEVYPATPEEVYNI